MTLAHPQALYWGLLAIPIVAVYLLRFRHPRQAVAAGWLWQRALATAPHGRSWRRWRDALSLLLQLAILGLIVGALTQPRRLAAWPPVDRQPVYAAEAADGLATALSEQAERQQPPPDSVRLWPWLLAAAAGLLVVEWGLHQRRWTS